MIDQAPILRAWSTSGEYLILNGWNSIVIRSSVPIKVNKVDTNFHSSHILSGFSRNRRTDIIDKKKQPMKI